MTDSPTELPPPTPGRLARSVVLALVVAGLILVLFVLPAEYAVDPTGFGRLLGLDRLAGSQVGNEPLPQALPGLVVPQTKEPKKEARTLRLRAQEQMELKMAMFAGDTVLFTWTADGELYSDFHAEPYGELEGQAIRYEEEVAARSGNGSLHAPFDGHHGWYWRNDGEQDVTVEIEIVGFFSVLKERRAP